MSLLNIFAKKYSSLSSLPSERVFGEPGSRCASGPARPRSGDASWWDRGCFPELGQRGSEGARSRSLSLCLRGCGPGRSGWRGAEGRPSSYLETRSQAEPGASESETVCDSGRRESGAAGAPRCRPSPRAGGRGRSVGPASERPLRSAGRRVHVSVCAARDSRGPTSCRPHAASDGRPPSLRPVADTSLLKTPKKRGGGETVRFLLLVASNLTQAPEPVSLS